MLKSFMKHEVPVLCGLAKSGVDFFKKIILTRLMDYNIFCLRLHSTTHFIQRMDDVFKAHFPHELMDQQASPYCIRYCCLVAFKKRLFAQSIVKLWGEEEEVH